MPAKYAPVYAVLIPYFVRCMTVLLSISSTVSNEKRTDVIACADDITIMLRTPKEEAIVQEEIRKYVAAS